MTIEIKAGQRWKMKREIASGGYGSVCVILFCNDHCVVYARIGNEENPMFSRQENILNNYVFLPQPKPRSIAKGDIMKMLAVNPVLYTRHICDRGSCHWRNHDIPTLWIENNLMILDQFEYSHNPFAPNPVIIGPEIEVME